MPCDYALKFRSVRKGDTFEKIADRFDVPVSVLRVLNKDKLTKVFLIPTGKTVKEIAAQMREVKALRDKMSTPAPAERKALPAPPPAARSEPAARRARPEPKPEPKRKPQRRGFNPWASLASMMEPKQ